MNVLIAIHHFPPRFTGGAEWRAYRTAQNLIARGHRVRVVCVEGIDRGDQAGVTWTDEIFKGVPVRRLFFNLALTPDQFRWKYDNPWIADHIRAMIAEDRPDVFHLFSGYLMTASALNAAKDAGVATLLSVTDFWFFCPYINYMRPDGHVCEGKSLALNVRASACVRCIGEEKRRFRYAARLFPPLMDWYWSGQKDQLRQMEDRIAFLGAALSRVDAIVCPSRFLRDSYVNAGVDPGRVIFARQGVDLAGIDPLAQPSLPPPLRIGYIGQLAVHKGVHVLVEAMSLLAGEAVQLSIYGDTEAFPDYTRALQAAAERDSRIRVVGRYARSEISAVFHSLDVLAMPSLWYENSPNVILEAFAFKLPVLTSNHGGMAELIQDGQTGYLFEVGSAASLAEKIRAILANPEDLARMRANITAVKTVEAEMDELFGLYARVAS